MKTSLIILCFAVSTMAQRPSFAGTSAKGYPELASRFRETSSDDQNATVVNRVGETSEAAPEAGPSTTVKIPIDARGDEELVKRLQTWPRENQPFWLINSEHIERNRNNSQQNQENVEGSKKKVDRSGH
ncbi:hypothetical protein NQ318_009370 [Aromia moschata]|uniref:Secreted RxLR effector peptide protein n=1 Tax=Aromia moschata TaxID=1265417 RepID=A0AAV8XEX3_9CUCU|nr:hypothetical protein NQ318_009370 [Aromia moschata]